MSQSSCVASALEFACSWPQAALAPWVRLCSTMEWTLMKWELLIVWANFHSNLKLQVRSAARNAIVALLSSTIFRRECSFCANIFCFNFRFLGKAGCSGFKNALSGWFSRFTNWVKLLNCSWSRVYRESVSLLIFSRRQWHITCSLILLVRKCCSQSNELVPRESGKIGSWEQIKRIVPTSYALSNSHQLPYSLILCVIQIELNDIPALYHKCSFHANIIILTGKLQ